MKLAEIEQEALVLNETERAALVLALMESLKAPESEISDQEVAERDQELESGTVTPMLHDEFVKRVRKPLSKYFQRESRTEQVKNTRRETVALPAVDRFMKLAHHPRMARPTPEAVCNLVPWP